MIVLYFTSEEDFMYWLNYTEIFMVVKVLVDFKLQIELWRFASDSYKDWNKTETGLQSDIDWLWRTQYSTEKLWNEIVYFPEPF